MSKRSRKPGKVKSRQRPKAEGLSEKLGQLGSVVSNIDAVLQSLYLGCGVLSRDEQAPYWKQLEEHQRDFVARSREIVGAFREVGDVARARDIEEKCEDLSGAMIEIENSCCVPGGRFDITKLSITDVVYFNVPSEVRDCLMQTAKALDSATGLKPEDLIPVHVVLAEYYVTRSTLERHRRAGTLQSHRPKGAGRTSPHTYRCSDIARLFTRKPEK